jgi:hypothetical protein
MEKITCTPEDLAAAFTEWERRYREEPDRFMSESERLLRQTPETYGEACAPYFLHLLREAAAGDAGPRDAEQGAARSDASRGTLDYITRGLARFREAAEAGGFEVGEVTLSFDEDQESVLLRVSLGIDAGLLKALAPATSAGPSRG